MFSQFEKLTVAATSKEPVIMQTKFKNANGDVSSYGLVCGNVQRVTINAFNTIRLYQEAACKVYQVRVW